MKIPPPSSLTINAADFDGDGKADFFSIIKGDNGEVSAVYYGINSTDYTSVPLKKEGDSYVFYADLVFNNEKIRLKQGKKEKFVVYEAMDAWAVKFEQTDMRTEDLPGIPEKLKNGWSREFKYLGSTDPYYTMWESDGRLVSLYFALDIPSSSTENIIQQREITVYSKYCSEKWKEFLKKYPHHRMTSPNETIYIDGKNVAALKSAAISVAEKIEYKSDLLNHWSVDDWSIGENGYGDCDDQAFMFRDKMIAMGYPRSALLPFALCSSNQVDEIWSNHVDLLVRTSSGDYVIERIKNDRSGRFEIVIVPFGEYVEKFKQNELMNSSKVYISVLDPAGSEKFIDLEPR